MKQIIVITAGLAAGFAIGMCLIEFNKYTTTSTTYILDLRKQVDSLQNELFIQQTISGQYEVALENLKSEDSTAAKKFEDQLSQTE